MKNKKKMKMNNKKPFPDFRVLVDRISFNDLLGHYGLLDSFICKGDQLRGSCPVHQGDNSTSFSVNISKNVYKCFSCGSQGNILDFVSDMEGCSKYQAGCLLEKWFSVGALSATGSSGTAGKSRVVERKEGVEKRVQEKKEGGDKGSGEVNGGGRASKDGSVGLSDGVNKPLNFVLKNLDTENGYLLSRVQSSTVKVFGLGVCSKGLMAGRLVIPIHNEKGELVAYAGRAVDEQTEKVRGKYKFPPNFHKGLVLFNLHRVLEHIQIG